MSFVPNSSQQMTIDDQYYSLTSREKKFLHNSWAHYFAENIFPKIDESRFAELYSDNAASRPGTPINICVGALLIKELRNQSDDDFLESLMFDYRYQYALHTSSMEEQPMSDRTLGRFRARCLEYEAKTGKDLLKEEILNLSSEMASIMQIDGSTRRMDSMMVASNIRKLSRLELLYTCLANMVKELNDSLGTSLPEQLIHYTMSEDRNQVIYHNKSDETVDKIATILDDCKTVVALCSDAYQESNNYLLLQRVLSEQTVIEEDGSYRLRTKEDGGMRADMLQNPSDPDATFREKAGRQHKGYTANIVESVGDGCSIVTDYDLAPNIHSDSEFARETFERLGKQEKKTTIVADGAFGGSRNIELAKENNIDLVTTNLTGRETADINADFAFSEDGTRVVKCPGGHEPKSCSYNPASGQCICSFYLKDCKGCPHYKECNPKEFKRTCRKVVSITGKRRAEQQRFRSSEEFSRFSKIRNGVETVPSYLRRAHNVDHMPVRGLQRCKLFFGLKVCGSNIKKLCRYLQGLSYCTPKTINC